MSASPARSLSSTGPGRTLDQRQVGHLGHLERHLPVSGGLDKDHVPEKHVHREVPDPE